MRFHEAITKLSKCANSDKYFLQSHLWTIANVILTLIYCSKINAGLIFSDTAETLSLIALCLFLAWAPLKFVLCSSAENGIFSGWIILGITLMLTILGATGSGVYFCVAIAFFTYFEGRKMFAFIPFLIVAFFMIPMRDIWGLKLAYALRNGATEIAFQILSIFGVIAEKSFATIQIGTESIAITDRCSGIEMLGTLVLIATVIAYFFQKNTFLRIFHFCFLLPSLLFANALRIAFMILAYLWAGKTVFDPTWHELFGFGQIGATIILFFIFGSLIKIAFNIKITGRAK